MENERARAGGEDPGEYACSGRAHCGVGAGMGVGTVFSAAHTVAAGVTCAVLALLQRSGYFLVWRWRLLVRAWPGA
jgi:hypothetical protein